MDVVEEKDREGLVRARSRGRNLCDAERMGSVVQFGKWLKI